MAQIATLYKDKQKTQAVYPRTKVSGVSNAEGTSLDTLLSNKVDKISGKQLSTNDFTTAEKEKLTGIAAGATKVESSTTNGKIKINGTETTVYTEVANTVHDANYKHITVTDTSVSDGTNTFNKYVHPGSGTNPHGTTKSDVGLGNVTNDAQVKRTEMGVANGVATLDANGKVPSAQLPSYVDDVLEYSSKSSFPTTGETGKIYVDTTTNLTYRWSGTAYVEISPSLALGETSSTAYAGDKGKANADAISTHTGNGEIHVTAANKTAWNAKYDKPSGGIPKTDLASAIQTSLGKADSAIQKVKTINNESLIGDGNIDITSAEWGNITGDIKSQTDLIEYIGPNVIHYEEGEEPEGEEELVPYDMFVAELAKKQNTLVSGMNIKTINGESLLSAGNLSFYTVAELDNLLQGNADAHNNFLVEEDITKYVTDGTLWDRIAGTNGFKPMQGIYPGCYIKMSRAISAYERTGQYQTTGSDYVTVAGCNIHKYDGDTSLGYNHLVMVPGKGVEGTQHFGRSRMNSSHVTDGGYVGSEMYTTTIGAVTSNGSTASTASINQQLYAEWGAHLKTTREILSKGINKTGYNRFGSNSGCSNDWGWYDCQARLMSEVEVYGSTVWSSSGYDTGNAKLQLPLFRLSKQAMNNRSAYYWLKDVASASIFCNCHNIGAAYYRGAGEANTYVRPCFILA